MIRLLKQLVPPPHDLAEKFVNLSIVTLTLRYLYVWGYKSYGKKTVNGSFPTLNY